MVVLHELVGSGGRRSPAVGSPRCWGRLGGGGTVVGVVEVAMEDFRTFDGLGADRTPTYAITARTGYAG